MATTITNNGASIKVDNGSTIRHLMKNQIIEVTIVKATKIKIDIGQGPLQNVFIEYSDVTSPASANIGALRDAINDMMANSVNSGSGGGDASAAKQDTQISNQNAALTKLDAANTNLNSINTVLNDMNYVIQQLYDFTASIDSKLFIEPSRVDESNPNSVYKGYAVPHTAENSPAWAIVRITNDNSIFSYKWADGNKNFDNIWRDRETLTYT